MSKILAQGMITLTQLYEGAQVILTPAAVLIPCDSEENPKSNAYINASTNVKAFLGTMDITSGITLGELEYSDSTVRASKTGTKVSITTITTRTGYVDIPVSATINGETIDLGKHRFNFVKQIDGQPGIPGDPGFGYTLNIKGGVRGVAYAANGTNPEPNTSSQFSVELLKNGVKVSNPASISWTCGGNLSGASSVATFTPAIKSTYASGSSYVKVSVKEFAASLAVEETIPIICTKHADGLDWINEWNNQYVQVGTEKIITPKIFAGTKNSANELTGVAIGRDVLGGNANKVIGIVGYKKNTPVFSLDQDANFFVSSSGSAGDIKNGTNNAKGLYFDGNNLYISGKVRISGGSTIGENNTLVEDVINNSNLGVQANNKLDNLQIGGTNLFRNSGFTKGYNHWNAYQCSSIQVIDEVSAYSRKAVKVVSTGGGLYQRKQSGETYYPNGTTFTVSGYVKANLAGKTLRVGFENAGSANAIKHLTIPNANTWQYFTHTHTITTDTFNTTILYGEAGVEYYFKDLQLEYGNKPTAWSPAPDDITADLNTKVNSSDVYKKTETYTKSETDSAINIAKDEINLGVSNTYETKANVETKINGVTIGGTNLVLNSHFDYDRNWSKGTGVTRVQEGFDGGYCMKTVGALKETRNFYQAISITKLEKGQEYTATVWMKTQDVVRGTTNPHLYFYASYSLNGQWVGECALSKAIPNGTTAWTKYVLTFTMPTMDFDAMSVAGYARDFTGTIWWDGIKLEKGNKATDWSPAPEDVDTNINNAKSEAINSANGTLTTTIANYYTKAQTDSQINVAKEAINLGVSNTYETKSNVETKVNNAINNIQIGGRNLISPAKVQAYTQYCTVKPNNTNGWTITKKETALSVAIKQSDFVPEVGKTYTFSGYATVNGQPVSAGFFANNRINTYLQPADRIVVNNGYFEVVQHWNASSVWILHCALAGVTNGVVVDFSNLMLEEGNKASAYTKNPNDVDEVIGSKANSADVYKKTEVYTKTETDSKIKLAQDNINLSVSQTYETKTNVETKVNNAVNNLQIGGRNIIGKDINNISKWSLNAPERFSISNVGYDNTLIYKTTGGGWETAISDGIAVIPNKEYVLSFEYEVFNKYSYLSGETFRVEVLSERIIGNSSKHKAIAFHTIENVVTPRKRVYITFTPTTSTIYLMINGGYIADGLQNLKFSFNKFKLEKGNKATDWTPAPEDVYTKEETNSQINIAKDSITNTVSQNYVTKNDATNTYATKSSLTQTTNSITAKFETSGGYNLLKNSGFKNEYAHWNLWHHNNPTGGRIERIQSSTTWGYPDASVVSAQIRLSNQSNIEYGIAQSFNTTIGKQYTLTFQYAGHRISGANAIIRGANGSWLAHKYFTPTDYNGGNGNVNNWGTYSLTFTATATSHALNIVITSAQDNGYLWVAKPQIVEGTVALPYTPHPSEIYEGSTIIDATGVTVNNGALRVKNNSGSTVLSGDSNGNLVLAGNITSNATISGGTITGGTLKSTNGDMRFDMNNGYMLLYNNGTKIGQTNKNSISGTSIYGVSNGAEYGSYACLSAKTSSGASTYQMMLTATGSDLSGANFKKGVTLGNTFHSNNWHFRLGSSTQLCWRQNGSNFDSFITEGSEGMLRLYGDNGMYLGYRAGDSNNYVIAIRENGSHTYPKSLSVFDDGVRPATDNNGYSLEVNAPLNMKGQSINQCSNIKTLGLEFIEPIAFNRNGEDKTRTLKVTKSTQNIVEFIGSAAIKNGEAIVDLPNDVSFKNYVVLLTPIGLDRKVSIVEKNDDNFKIVGDDGIVDYVIKFESMDYASYISKSISEDNTDIIIRSEEDKPKEIFIEN